MAGKSKATVIRFERVDKSEIKGARDRSRSGAATGPNRRRAHGRHHKHR